MSIITIRDGIAAVIGGLLIGIGATVYNSQTTSEPINYTTPKVAGMKNIKIPEGVTNPLEVLGTWNDIEGILVDYNTGMPNARLRLDSERRPVGFDRVNDEIIYNKRTNDVSLGYTPLLTTIPAK